MALEESFQGHFFVQCTTETKRVFQGVATKRLATSIIVELYGCGQSLRSGVLGNSLKHYTKSGSISSPRAFLISL